MKMKAKMEDISRVCVERDGYFKRQAIPTTLHNLLWQIIVNKNLTSGCQIVFFAEHNECEFAGYGIELLVVEQDVGGYRPTGLKFDTDDLDEAQEIAEEMTADVFGLNKSAHRKVISSSMFKNK